MSNDVALCNFAAAFLSHEPPLSWGQNGLLLFQPRISPTIRGFEEEDGGRNLTLSMLEWRRGGDVEEGAYLEGNLLRTCLVSQIPKLWCENISFNLLQYENGHLSR